MFMILDPTDKPAHVIPRNPLRSFMKDIREVYKVSSDIGRIRFNSVVSKVTKVDYLPK